MSKKILNQTKEEINELKEKIKKIKKVKKVLPAVVLFSSYHYSFWLMAGLILGYFACRFYYKHLIQTGKIDLIYLDIGNYKIHMHHWIMGVIALFLIWIIGSYYVPMFLMGLIGGVIAHDIYDFDDWHEIIIKNEAKIKNTK